MAKKRKKAAQKKHAKKRTANKRKTTTANEVAETEAVEKWVRIMDKPLAIREGDRRRLKGRKSKRRGKLKVSR
jgi:hypothetical protein